MASLSHLDEDIDQHPQGDAEAGQRKGDDHQGPGPAYEALVASQGSHGTARPALLPRPRPRPRPALPRPYRPRVGRPTQQARCSQQLFVKSD